MKLMFTETKKADNIVVRNRPGNRSNRCLTLCCSIPKSEGYKRSVAFQGPSRWDKLPLRLKLFETIEESDREIKEYYLVNFLTDGVV